MKIILEVHGSNRLTYEADFRGAEYENLTFNEEHLADAAQAIADRLVESKRAHGRKDYVEDMERSAARQTQYPQSRVPKTDLPKTDAVVDEAKRIDETRS